MASVSYGLLSQLQLNSEAVTIVRKAAHFLVTTEFLKISPNLREPLKNTMFPTLNILKVE